MTFIITEVVGDTASRSPTGYTTVMEPVILIVPKDRAEGARLRDELDRYRRDYRLEVVASGDVAMARLTESAAAGTPVAMVLADLAQGVSDGVDVLARVRNVSPTTRCVLLLEWGLRGDQMPAVSRAVALGVVDTVLTKPTGPRDEEFHGAITEDLGEWSWTTAPVVEAVRIVSADGRRGREIHEVLDRLGVPVGVHHPDSAVGAAIARRVGRQGWRTLVEVMGATTLADPSNRELAAAFGATVDVASSVFDLAIVGAGPAGLGAAVYGASEGLHTLVLEAEAFGGQAGTSSMIRNYLGFPRGITGRQLGRRAVLQATGFGAAFDLAELSPVWSQGHLTVYARRRCCGRCPRRDPGLRSDVSASRRRTDRSARRPWRVLRGVVHRGACTARRRCRGRRCGQLWRPGRGASGTVCRQRDDRRTRGVVVGDDVRLPGPRDRGQSSDRRSHRSRDRRWRRATRLEWIEIADRGTGRRERLPAAGLFILIGTETRTAWLPTEFVRDDHGFLVTGEAVDPPRWPLARPPHAFETSVPGVFAVGDVRANSMKRVAAAVGEGSIVVPMVHQYLEQRRRHQ